MVRCFKIHDASFYYFFKMLSQTAFPDKWFKKTTQALKMYFLKHIKWTQADKKNHTNLDFNGESSTRSFYEAF